MTETTADQGETYEPLGDGRRRYVLFLLFGVSVVNFIDRQIINILAEPIKLELGLADWQLGLLTGLAFALLYAVLGVPIARYSEWGNRPRIIAVSVTVWSLCTALCGVSQTFAQLLLARIGVGVGEAGGTPPAHSLIVDYVPPNRRGSALATFGMGAPVGTLVGMILGGFAADAFGWRHAFLLVGIPGVLLGLLAFKTLPEPRLTKPVPAATRRGATMSWRASLAFLARRRTFIFLVAAMVLNSFIAYGTGPFATSFLLRNHGAEIASLADNLSIGKMGMIGLFFGLTSGVFGVAGIIIGGRLADRLGTLDPRWLLRIPAIAVLVCTATNLTFVLAPSATLAFAAWGATSMLNVIWYGPAWAALFSVVPSNLRATASATLLLMTSLLGLGLGPVGIGLLSDMQAQTHGSGEGLRNALVVAYLIGVVTSFCFWKASTAIRKELCV